MMWRSAGGPSSKSIYMHIQTWWSSILADSSLGLTRPCATTMKRSRADKRKGKLPVGYAKRLESGHYKGRCGGAEVEVPLMEMESEAKRLAQLLSRAPVVVVHTGAGLSTAAGIPDFRGKDGVWTREKQGHPLPDYERCWDNAIPTLGHMALAGLVQEGIVDAIVSQNVDGLHLRSGVPRDRLCELHGNLFMEACPGCKREFRRTADVGGVGFQPTGRSCPHCSEGLVDVLLDWEDQLRDYDKAVELSNRCRAPGGVGLCLGTSLQIAPSKDLPAKADKMVIVNLQKTSKDARAEIVIRAKIDAVMRCVMEELGIPIPVYRRVEILVVSHTCCRAAEGDRWKWAISVGDAADGARCGYVEAMTVSFPGTKLAKALINRPPFRVARTTKARLLRRSYDEGNKADGSGGGSTVSTGSTGGDHCDEKEKPRVGEAKAESGVGARVTGVGVGIDSPSVGVEWPGVCDESSRISGFITAVIALNFVAAPGHGAPEPQVVEYNLNLSAETDSLETPVLLGEVDYNARR